MQPALEELAFQNVGCSINACTSLAELVQNAQELRSMRLYNNMSDDAGAAAIAKVLIPLFDEAMCCHGGMCMIATVLIAAMQGNCHFVYVFHHRKDNAKKGEGLVVLIESIHNNVLQHLLQQQWFACCSAYAENICQTGDCCLHCMSAAGVLCYWSLTCSATPPEPGTASKHELPFADQLHSYSAATAAICLFLPMHC